MNRTPMIRLAMMLLTGIYSALLPAFADDVNPQEQLFIYELNRARNDPVRFQLEHSTVVTADFSTVASQMPLALNAALNEAARARATEMVTNGYCMHQSFVTGRWPNQIARDHGYPLPADFSNDVNNIESIYCATGPITIMNTIVEDGLAALLEDDGINPPGHRLHLLAIDPFFQDNREIGCGIMSILGVFNGANGARSRIAVQTAQVDPTNLFLTGVAYRDANGNSRYDLGEGLGAVSVSDGVSTVLTRPTGGWAIQVAPGTYDVHAAGGQFSGIASAQVTVVDKNIEVDFQSGNDQGEVDFANQTPIVTPVIRDLAVTKLKAPKRITSASSSINIAGSISVSIQNLSPNNATISDMATLENLVTVRVQSLGACPDLVPVLQTPKHPFPITLTPKKKLTVVLRVTYDCANDPLATDKTMSHNDYRTLATIHADALTGKADTNPENDACPRGPHGLNKGCGSKNPVTKQLGGEVLTDVVGP
jgi:hypothetical protein